MAEALTIRMRSWWGATAPIGLGMILPVDEVWLHHSVTQLTADPTADMRAIERVGVQRFGRISYSWAYHRPSRTLLEGAGDTVGAHTAGRNSTSLGLVLIGNYDQADLDDVAVSDLGEALRWLVDTGRLQPGSYPTGGHRDLKQTACPGGRAYRRLDDIRTAMEEEIVDEATMDRIAEKSANKVWLKMLATSGDSEQPAMLVVKDIFGHARLAADYAKRALAGQLDVGALAEELARRLPAAQGPVSVTDLKTALTEVLGSLDEGTG